MVMKLKKKRKNWKEGDICFWCENVGHGKFEVKWARVEEVFSDSLAVDFLQAKENRVVHDLIRDVSAPIDEWKDEKYHKLPKGWTYDTPLYAVERVPYDEEMDSPIRNFDLRNPKSIQNAYDEGLLVKASDVFQGQVDSDITKEGYRIILTYPMWEYKKLSSWIRPFDARYTLDEALRDVRLKEHELLRQCNLTDEEWSWEQIENDIKRYAKLMGYDMNHSEIRGLIEYFKGFDNIVEIETRLVNTKLGIQWKRENQKKWRNVAL